MAIRSKDVSLVPRKFLLEREERRVCSTGALVRLFDRHVNGKKTWGMSWSTFNN